MPIKVPDNLPALVELRSEKVDIITSVKALKQDIRPLRIVMLNLMPKKQETEIQFARLFGHSPLQIELTLMTTNSYSPTHTEPSYLEQFYKCLDDIKDEYFDALVITGAPVEKLPFKNVAYWNELTEIIDWSMTHCFRRLGVCWGAQALLSHLFGIEKHECEEKHSGIFQHLINTSDRLMHGFVQNFPMPVSRYTEIRKSDLVDGLTVIAENDECGVGIIKNSKNGDLFITNHIEYDGNTLLNEYQRDLEEEIPINLPKDYFPDDNPNNEPINFWRPYAFLFIGNWISDLYQSTPFDLKNISNNT